ncbi:DUF808 domain-containing protein [Sagittula salina]|uniref:DUF808 domain-containing protein n=1 Tax=Sagittula salina TaxID=2820268 RepID=A0A940S1C0_9RHOB|nr:DUF808 domain-containing protein [Sagittula salina]MBP0482897.1 DUF808 domain-containing protein [Sagittula salina]
MSGLLALLDDVAGIAKVAAASVDDISTAALKAGSKTAGVVIDDTAVTPKYVAGLKPARELPIIWRIARGSVINKLVFLLPAVLLMAAFAPWLVWPLLILGGCYLSFEGAEKVVHAIMPHDEHTGGPDGSHDVQDPSRLEETKVKGAIKTDFILSAEIMVILLSNIGHLPTFWHKAAALALAGIVITAVVYGAVAIIVKMDDIGLWLSKNANLGITRAFGRGLVKGMPWLLWALTVIGTAAMIWVGGAIIVHSLAEMGWHTPEHFIEHWAHVIAGENPTLLWLATAAMDFVLGFVVGLVLIPIATKIIMPLWGAVFGSKDEVQAH